MLLLFRDLKIYYTRRLKHDFMKSNLLITYDPHKEGSARAEAEAVLAEIKEKPIFEKSRVEGVFLVKISEPKSAVKKLVEVCKKSPERFEVTFRYIPIEQWTKSSVPGMEKIIKELVKGIRRDEKWKMEINKRHYDILPNSELILKLTEVVDREKVDLKKPEKIIQVEILGENAGISLLKPAEILDAPKLKRGKT